MEKISSVLIVMLLLAATIEAQWVQTSLSDKDIRSLAASATNTFAGTEVGGVFLSTNNGTDWSEVNNGLDANNSYRSLTVSGTNIITGSSSSGVFLSANNGINWSLINPDWVYGTSALASDGVNIFAGTGNVGIYLTTNNGSNWTQVNNGLDLNYPIRCLLISGLNVFTGTEGKGVFLSTNNGAVWTQLSLGMSGLEVRALAISGTNIFAGTYGSGGVFISTNNGTDWVLVSTGLIPFVTSLAVSGTNLFAGTSSGVYLSTNNGQNWTQVGLIGNMIRALTVNGTSIFAGTGASGVWKRSIDEMITSVETDLKNLPMNFSLEQNYPNPFNPSTRIQYAISNTQFVSLKVYDVLGNDIATLVNEEKPAGTYEVNWNAANLPSGVYYYQLRAGSFVQTKKMLLIK